MAKALTIEEKVARATAKINEAQTGVVTEEKKVVQIRKASDRPTRKERGVFNGTKRKLSIPDSVVIAFREAGWHLHIFNDSEGRIEYALAGGYEFVTKDEIGVPLESVVPSNTDLGNKVRFRVGSKESGDGLFAYLMKIPTVDYEEEQKSLNSQNNKIDDAIRAGKNVKAGTSSDGFYGQEGIKIQQS